MQQNVAGKAHAVDRHHIPQLHARVDGRPGRAAQGFVETADFKGDTVWDGLDVGQVHHPIVRIGRVDEAAHPIPHTHSAAAQIFLHATADLHNCATAFVAQGTHRVGVGAVSLAVRAQLHLWPAFGLVLGAHSNVAVEVALRAADRRLVGFDQHLGRLQWGQGDGFDGEFVGFQIDHAGVDHTNFSWGMGIRKRTLTTNHHRKHRPHGKCSLSPILCISCIPWLVQNLLYSQSKS